MTRTARADTDEMAQSAGAWTPLGKPSVLVVENSPEERDSIRGALEPGYQVHFVSTLGAALPALRARWPDLFIADVGFVDQDGCELCLEIRDHGRQRAVPILLRPPRSGLAGLRTRIAQRLRALEPVEPGRAALREWGRLRIDFATLRVWVLDGPGTGEVLDLTLREFRILQFLVENEGRVVTRQELLDHVWRDVVVAPRAVDTHVCNLRKKLGSLRGCIGSIRGVGYRFQTDRT